MSTVRSRWEALLAGRLKLLAAARKRHEANPTPASRALITLRKAQVAYAQRVVKRHTPKVPPARARIVSVARQAAANYRKNPGDYHYFAGGVPNNIILTPSPRRYRSDCSQFFVSVYEIAGVACPGTGTYLFSNTISIAHGGRVVAEKDARPGDAGMYGSRWSPHHIELVAAVKNGCVTEFIGHGTQPIDSRTPGRPSFYLSFLND